MNRLGMTEDRDLILAIDTGRRIRYVWARLDSETDLARAYRYKWKSKSNVAIIPHSAQPRYMDCDLALGFGCKEFPFFCLRAGTLQGTGWDAAGSQLNEEQIAALVLDGLVVKLSKSLTAGGFDWKWLVALAGIAAVAFIGYQLINNGKSEPATPTPPPEQTLPAAAPVMALDAPFQWPTLPSPEVEL